MAFSFSRTEKLRLSWLAAVVGLHFGAIGFAPNVQGETPKERSARLVIYNYISQEADPIDQMIRDHYGRKYEIAEIRKDPTYSSARLTRTSFPNPVYDNTNT